MVMQDRELLFSSTPAPPEQVHFHEMLSLSGIESSHFVPSSYHLIASWHIFVLDFSVIRTRKTKWILTLLFWAVDSQSESEFQAFRPSLFCSWDTFSFVCFSLLFFGCCLAMKTAVYHVPFHSQLLFLGTPCWRSCLWQSCPGPRNSSRKGSLWCFEYNFCVLVCGNLQRRLKLLRNMDTEESLFWRAPLSCNNLVYRLNF